MKHHANITSILVFAILSAMITGCSIQSKKFDSPDEALMELKQATLTHDQEMLLTLFGSEGQSLLKTADEVSDQQDLEKFSAALQQEAEWVTDSEQLILVVGENKWPFPIPLVQNENGWSFDTAEGAEEIIDRRIGENEIGAIGVCDGYVDAQYEFALADPDNNGIIEFAQKVISSDGKKDGLYWKDDKQQSPLGPFIADAVSEGYKISSNQKKPYHGYYYRILTEQGPNATSGEKNYINDEDRMTGGFALVAYPAEWGESGVMTFIVNHEGTVFEKNLGEDTIEVASEMTAYDPDPTWKEAYRGS